MSGTPEEWRRPRAASRRQRRSPRRVALRAALLSLAAGPVVGLGWWATALGGAGGRGTSYLDLVQSVGAADAGFALACLLAGAVGGVWWVLAREDEHDERGVARLVGLLVGGLVAAVLAWLTGAALSAAVPLEVPGVRPEAVEELTRPRMSLAVVAGCLLWPLGVGVLVAVDTLRELAWQALTRTDPADGGPAPGGGPVVDAASPGAGAPAEPAVPLVRLTKDRPDHAG
ncbi:hypothetical protein [Aquipuribacter hungaricus]|uniref:Uncharacterized protein n=1 Tax=Aquipuribacter hungaricus TaxID=545624 RepID=A0ABV7WKA4_9MICO